MPNHEEVRLFLNHKASSNCVAQAAHEHETPSEDRIGLANDLGNNKDDQPAHDQVKSETELFIDFWQRFCREYQRWWSPLDQDNAVAHPVVHQGKGQPVYNFLRSQCRSWNDRYYEAHTF